jgi:hypothetical protein
MRLTSVVRLAMLCGTLAAGQAHGDSKKHDQLASLEPDIPRRAKVTCAKLRQQLDRNSRQIGLNDRIAPRSWGNVPDDLRKLPPGAELCGAEAELGQVVITSGLYGKELESYYAPLFARIGCQPLACNVIDPRSGLRSQTRCRCSVPGVVGTITTDLQHQAFSLVVTR